MDLAIVVAGFSRLESIKRITSSILTASYCKGNITLYYSIDFSHNQDLIMNYINSINWDHGDLKIISYPDHLGLREHILRCGDLSQIHDAIILLEDDLYVSKDFFNYALQSLDFYKDESRVAGIALYGKKFIETHEMGFIPLKSDWDGYFLQVPCSWGQAWSKEQWSKFRKWYSHNNTDEVFKTKIIPEDVLIWPKTSWKKFYYQYMVEKDLYFTYPYNSHSTNFSDLGENIYDNRTFLQVELAQKEGIDYSFQKFSQSNIKYDHAGEPLPRMFNSLSEIVDLDNLTIDLYGNKNLTKVKTDYILTTKIVKTSIRSFARKLKPHELNIIQNIPGNEIRLAKRSNCQNQKINLNAELSYYYNIPTYHLSPHDLRHYKNLLSVNYKMSFFKIIFGYPIFLKLLSLKGKISNYIIKRRKLILKA